MSYGVLGPESLVPSPSSRALGPESLVPSPWFRFLGCNSLGPSSPTPKNLELRATSFELRDSSFEKTVCFFILSAHLPENNIRKKTRLEIRAVGCARISVARNQPSQGGVTDDTALAKAVTSMRGVEPPDYALASKKIGKMVLARYIQKKL